ncbi:hypothetical protein LWM68_26215 [Niabella sp. W65]|nr:hypothetical protein [Niabella sp. W65]MCH7365956.1 hypothetical protein [Niabella sp. W65]
MMLQMLVENAIKHGISHQKKRGLVKLGATLANNTLELKVENTGRLKEQQQGGGFGIRSIRERLKLMYGNNAMFNIKQSSDKRLPPRLSYLLLYKIKYLHENNYH